MVGNTMMSSLGASFMPALASSSQVMIETWYRASSGPSLRRVRSELEVSWVSQTWTGETFSPEARARPAPQRRPSASARCRLPNGRTLEVDRGGHAVRVGTGRDVLAAGDGPEDGDGLRGDAGNGGREGG